MNYRKQVSRIGLLSSLFLFSLCMGISADARGTGEKISFDPDWEYAGNSEINSGQATLYHADPSKSKGIVVCVNAGHGTKGGESKKTLCHPDGSPKVTGGSTQAGATKAPAIASGMSFPDGTSEAEATLSLALLTKEELLDDGFDVLMIREKDDVQLDNIARTVMANQNANCHIALHYDSTESDKGVFFLSVPSSKTYRAMMPVKKVWKRSNRLGRTIVSAIHEKGFSLFNEGEMETDLTQTSYSSIPSIDLEVGDGASDISEKTQRKLARGIRDGLNKYFKKTINRNKKKKVTKVTLEGISHRIAQGKSIKLYARLEPEGASAKDLTWTSDQPEVAEVNKKGKVTIKDKTGGSLVIIKAEGSGCEDTWNILVMKDAVEKIVLQKDGRDLKEGETLEVPGGSSLNLKAAVTAGSSANTRLRWISSDEKAVKVSQDGKVEALKAGTGKTVVVKAKATDGSGVKQSVKIHITE